MIEYKFITKIISILLICVILPISKINAINNSGNNIKNINPTLNNIKIKLKELLPNTKIITIKPSAIANLYIVIAGGNKVFYINSDADYIIIGNMFNLTTKENITQTLLTTVNKVDWSKLNTELAIKVIIGKGKTKIAVFIDPDCPFCKRFEKETLTKLNNITIFYFLLPQDIHANAMINAKKIICSENPEKSYKDWVLYSIPLPNNTTCVKIDYIAKIKLMADSYGIDKTPATIMPNGNIIYGLLSIADLATNSFEVQ